MASLFTGSVKFRKSFMAKYSFFIFLIMLQVAPATAGTAIPAGMQIVKKTPYMFSAILKADKSGEITIKLVQSMEQATSRDEAMGIGVRKALEEFHGYSVVSTLATPAELNECGYSI